MAFIRAYAMAGDPFRFRVPKFLKKAAKAVVRVAKVAAPVAAFIPGLGVPALAAGIAARAGKVGGLARAARRGAQLYRQVTTPDTAPKFEEEHVRAVPNIIRELEEPQDMPRFDDVEIEEPEPEPEDEETYENTDTGMDVPAEDEVDWLGALQYARAYGFEGDPAVSRRKRAAAGPRAKATVKKQVRAAKSTGMVRTGPQKRRPKSYPSVMGGAARGVSALKGLAGRVGSHLPGAAGAVAEFLKEQQGGKPGKTRAGGAGGGHRRRVNPTNIKALRRSASRLVQFEKTVHRVRKSLRGLGAAIAPQHRAAAPRRGRK